MKKIFTFFLALVASVWAFASRDQVPSDAVLQNYYDAGQVCVCIFVPAEIACNDIVLTGLFNNWSNIVADCKKFRAVVGYDGWYVASFIPEANPDATRGIQAEPLMLDMYGNFHWDYIIGVATVVRGAVQVVQSYPGEIDLINYGTDAPNVLTVEAWQNNPCSKVQVGDLCYNLDDTHQTAEVTYQYSWPNNNYPGLTTANIPASIVYNDVTYSVTSIGESAFSYCSDLTSVTIGNNVINIATYSFSACNSLISINVSANNPNYSSLDGVLFNKDKTTLMQCPKGMIGEYSIPNSVTSIEGHAFSDCSGLTSVTISNNVTNIGEWVFSSCSGLTSVTIGNSVTSIGDYAFDNCTGLTSVTIGNSVTSIGDYAFYNCTGLTSVTINSDAIVSKNYTSGSSIKDIFGAQVKEYNIGSSVTSIGYWAFSECNSLTSVTIGNSVTRIGDYAFINCNSLTSVTIGNSVTRIGDYAFMNCSSLNSVTIGNSVEYIGGGGSAFYGCSNLTDIYATCGDLERVKQLFHNDNRVKYAPLPYAITINATNGSVSIPQNICDALELIATSDYGYHFAQWNDGNTDNPRTIELTQDTTFTAEFAPNTTGLCGDNLQWSLADSTLTIVGTGDMWNEQPWIISKGAIKQVVFPQGITSIGSGVFSGGINLKSITIPENVVSIGENAFNACSSLISVTIGNSVTSIGTDAFKDCYVLKEVILNSNNIASSRNLKHIFGEQVESYYLGDAVTNIGDYAFYGCSNLTSIEIPNSVISIGKYTFSYCTNLTSVTIPKSVTSIGVGAFCSCRSLTSVIWNAKSCNDYTRVETPFYDHNESDMRGQISSFVFGNEVEHIPAYLCYGFSQLTSVTIPNSIASTGKDAFKDCFSLSSVYISDVAAWCQIVHGSLESNPLVYANKLYLDGNLIDNLVIPEEATRIGNYAFYGYNVLTSVTIPNSVTWIGEKAFYHCSFSSVSIPNSVAHLGNDAFKCDNLKEVTLFANCIAPARYLKDVFGVQVEKYYIGDGVISIGSEAFRNCTYLTSVIIGNSVTSIEAYAFIDCTNLLSVTIGNSVTDIGNYAFYNCTGLQKIYNHGQNPADVNYSTTFDGVNKSSCTLYVPRGSINKYKNAAVWRDFYNIEPLENVEAIEDVIDSHIGSSEGTSKVLRDGQILILRGDKTYTMQGQEVR